MSFLKNEVRSRLVACLHSALQGRRAYVGKVLACSGIAGVIAASVIYASQLHSSVWLAAGDGEPLPELMSYNWDVRPVLSQNCFRCHGPDAQVRKAGLRLDVREMAYGELPKDRGKQAIVPGNPG